MDNEELRAETWKDFLEIKDKAASAFYSFKKRYSQYVLHSVTETKTYKTRQNNTWTLVYFNILSVDNQLANFIPVAYATVRRESGTDYIVLRSFDMFVIELYTAHFIKRYKERYLIPHGIKPAPGMPTLIYFLMYNSDLTLANFYKQELGAENEPADRFFWIANHGILANQCEGRMLVFITFLEEEKMSRVKKRILDEERFWAMLEKLNRTQSQEETDFLCQKIYNTPDARILIEGYFRRNVDPQNMDYALEEWEKYWATIEENIREREDETGIGHKPKIKLPNLIG